MRFIVILQSSFISLLCYLFKHAGCLAAFRCWLVDSFFRDHVEPSFRHYPTPSFPSPLLKCPLQLPLNGLAMHAIVERSVPLPTKKPLVCLTLSLFHLGPLQWSKPVPKLSSDFSCLHFQQASSEEGPER